MTELFNHILLRVPGIVEAARIRARIEPSVNPMACIVVWKVELEETDPFELECRLVRKIRATIKKKK